MPVSLSIFSVLYSSVLTTLGGLYQTGKLVSRKNERETKNDKNGQNVLKERPSFLYAEVRKKERNCNGKPCTDWMTQVVIIGHLWKRTVTVRRRMTPIHNKNERNNHSTRKLY